MNLPSGLGHALACGLHPLVMFERRGTVEQTLTEMRPSPAPANQDRYQMMLPRQRVPGTVGSHREIATPHDTYFNKPEYSTEAVKAGQARVRRDARQPGDGGHLRASGIPCHSTCVGSTMYGR